MGREPAVPFTVSAAPFLSCGRTRVVYDPQACRGHPRPAAGERIMIPHTGSCLAGPVSAPSEWWRRPRHKCKSRAPRPTDDGVRVDLVMRIRKEIAEGRYDIAEKLEIALFKFLRQHQHP